MTNLTSPGYPLQYPSDLDCHWVVVANDGMVIVARIKFFDLERSFDFLTVGDGPESGLHEIASLTGSVKIRALTSSTSSMWMALTTDKTGQMSGYRLELDQISASDSEGMGRYVTRLWFPEFAVLLDVVKQMTSLMRTIKFN